MVNTHVVIANLDPPSHIKSSGLNEKIGANAPFVTVVPKVVD